MSTETQLQNAVWSASPNTTIMITAGTYNLTSTLYLNGVNNVTLRGATGNRDDVVLVGKGMSNANYGSVPFGVWVNGQRVTIANLTIRDVYDHAIILNAGAESPRIYNVHLVNTGQQFIKANPDGSGGGVDNGIVEFSLIEYTATSRDYYTNGVDVHTASGWIVRNNLFRNITAPSGQLAGPSVLIWNNSRGATVEGNTFINCQREIALGLQEQTPDDNNGGIVRNNFIYRTGGMSGDAAIFIGDSPDTQVLHNTILLNGTYPNAIEYRFSGTKRVLIANNLVSGQIQARDGATGTVSSNYLNATAALFVNAGAGDLHLKSSATAVIDKVSVTSGASTDWDGEVRPMGSSADYGADEYTSTTSPPSNPPPLNRLPTVSITGPAAGAGFTAPATINISATASDPDGTIARVDFLAGGTVIGSDNSSPYSFGWTNVGTGTFGLTAIAYDNAGASTTSAPVTVTVSGSSSGSLLPAPWSSKDIGGPTLVGSGMYASGTFTVKGGGVDIWNGSDQFQFVSQPMSGDGQIVARVASLTNTNGWTKAGVMIRSTLTADSPHAFALVTPSNGVAFQRRTTIGGSTTHTSGATQGTPYWVKLVRSGSLFTAYSSPDGMTWTVIGSSNIAMGSSAFAGLAVTSHMTSAVATATFSAVDVTDRVTNQRPTVMLTAPAPGTSFSAPATVGLGATATDLDGSIVRVDFYSGTTLLGSDASGPYAFSWGSVSAGTYAVTAVAVDSSGATTTSAPVAVTVNSPPVSATPTTLAFAASADNATNVTSYTLDIFVAGANPSTATPVKTQALGKPPIANGNMSADIKQLIASLPSGSYFGTVTAVGPGGSTRSSPSNTFTR